MDSVFTSTALIAIVAAGGSANRGGEKRYSRSLSTISGRFGARRRGRGAADGNERLGRYYGRSEAEDTPRDGAAYPAGYREHETTAGLVSYLEARLRTNWHVVRHSNL